jgi:sulfite reductase (ferredoxin)
MVSKSWKDELASEVAPELSREIDIFETQMQLRKEGNIDEKIFAESRLRRGVYGQRYDNGQRYDGVRTQDLNFPCGDITKGPETVWDAPGMLRIKIPFGGITNAQMDLMADLAEEYSDCILHVTTRQDIQLHFIHIEDAPDLMRRLGSVGITTREACGNSIRNVTACPISGVCKDEAFDTTPYAKALTYYFLGHPDVQDFGRKFKVSFSGCGQHACGLAGMHDLGLIGVTREVDGEVKRGFEFFVGGGLGAVPRQSQLLDDFVSEEELLPLSQAVCRVFAQHGEKANRSRARLKFLVKKLGIDTFREMVLAEKAAIPHDERWTMYLDDLGPFDAPIMEAGAQTIPSEGPEGYTSWVRSNVELQRQPGYAIATISLPLGDFTSQQARDLTDVARKHAGDTLRATVEQNVVMRWVRTDDLPALYADLVAIGLGEGGAATLMDVTSCPGTDTCKLGISASRGLAGVLREQVAEKIDDLSDAARNLRVKVSGCFNACGQHHISDLGFLGVSRNVGGRRVPHFQVVVGGQWSENAGSFGLAVGAVPSKRIPMVVDRLTDRYAKEGLEGEVFKDFVYRIGKKEIRSMVEDLMVVPSYEEAPEFYTDWGDAREYTIGDMGVGECAGEVVSMSDFGMAEAERIAFEAQDFLDQNDAMQAASMAYGAMLAAARALTRAQVYDAPDAPEDIVSEFKTRFCDTGLFFDKYAKGKFANYLFQIHQTDLSAVSIDDAHEFIEEANLFIEAAHGCHERMIQAQQPAGA